MKNIKKYFNINSNCGAIMLEFIIIMGVTFSIIVAFIEVGFALKSESMIIGLAEQTARIVATTGKLTTTDVSNLRTKLNSNEINNVIVTVAKQDYNSTTYNNYIIGSDLGYRQNYKVYVRGDYTLKLASFFGHDFTFPLVYAADGSVERFKF